ncbi:hypothetical protein [Pseudoclavibacter sp. VKM Ac-2888]|uniref:hypothetical protein n=1 Tax=Pseudoclavibacter sp. VKM Ac-2888 TaxID=2783830 RepID=UPI00188A206E|nr:hypothetical protein [Pseudoclavibacter sp. VKM Ac-2888]MBF4550700.1 hypothetical protein [Pseudoclavibacter sp. VKM Ac-2888]
MYALLVILQTVVLPLIFGGVHLGVAGGNPAIVFGIWFAFWGVGIRLIVAGISQLTNPRRTTQTILGAAHDDSQDAPDNDNDDDDDDDDDAAVRDETGTATGTGAATDTMMKTGAATAQVVQELGLANLSLGVVALVSSLVPGWGLIGALPGAIYLGLAGLRHLAKRGKSTNELVATWTDLLVFLLVVGGVVAAGLRGW